MGQDPEFPTGSFQLSCPGGVWTVLAFPSDSEDSVPAKDAHLSFGVQSRYGLCHVDIVSPPITEVDLPPIPHPTLWVSSTLGTHWILSSLVKEILFVFFTWPMRNLRPRDLVGQVLKSQLSTLNCCKWLFFLNLRFIFGCAGPLLQSLDFLWLWWAGATLHCGVWASLVAEHRL